REVVVSSGGPTASGCITVHPKSGLGFLRFGATAACSRLGPRLLARRDLAQLPQGRKAARVSELFRVREGLFSCPGAGHSCSGSGSETRNVEPAPASEMTESWP